MGERRALAGTARRLRRCGATYLNEERVVHTEATMRVIRSTGCTMISFASLEKRYDVATSLRRFN